MLASTSIAADTNLYQLPLLNDPSAQAVKEFWDQLTRFKNRLLTAGGNVSQAAKSASALINLIDPDLLESVFAVDPYFLTEKAADATLTPTTLTETQLEAWVQTKIVAYKGASSQPAVWREALSRIITKIDPRLSATDNLLPTIVTFDKLTKQHHMETLLLNSTKIVFKKKKELLQKGPLSKKDTAKLIREEQLRQSAAVIFLLDHIKLVLIRIRKHSVNI
jgi:hypothetical protein